MLLPAANGLAPVNAPNAPPLTLPDTLDEGILSLAPSVRAAAAFVKYAYVVTAPTLGLNVQLVFTVIVALPFEVPFAMSAKLTKPGDAVTVREVVKLAAKLTPAILELSCACTGAPTRKRRRSGKLEITPLKNLRGASPFDLWGNLNTTTMVLFQHISSSYLLVRSLNRLCG
jgi:hypothetical protein